MPRRDDEKTARMTAVEDPDERPTAKDPAVTQRMVNPQPGRAPRESVVTKTEFVLPSDANALGNVFGGRVMEWIDIAAAIAAGRHCRSVVVTASMDDLHFLAPIKVGDVVVLQAQVNFAGRTSLE
ncbi:MAG TPA: acyl-CoA thioesterase, partial [bacterium]|nr:acyl-CoA thioesterase [bacterium]